MRELSLFTGAGGGLLASHLLDWTPIGYVEYDDYCQRVIAARIRDGILPNAPIFGDIRAFNRDGYAAAYQGLVDVITAGFPCQPFSVAGKRAAGNDERNMWPATIECVRMVRPRFAFLENVPGLLTTGYFERILCDLSESGYSVRWRCLSAIELGAPHKRDRLWIVAHAQGERARGIPVRSRRQDKTSTDVDGMGANVAHTDQERRHGWAGAQWTERRPEPAHGSQHAGDMENSQCQPDRPQEERQEIDRQDAPRSTSGIGGSGWWTTEPAVGRVADGVAHRVDRLRAIGNGQVPAVAATAWRLLTADLFHHASCEP
jgi:DNA (cytosine-5)-methyltransferase 1